MSGATDPQGPAVLCLFPEEGSPLFLLLYSGWYFLLIRRLWRWMGRFPRGGDLERGHHCVRVREWVSGGQSTGRSPGELPGCVMSGKSRPSGHWSCRTQFRSGLGSHLETVVPGHIGGLGVTLPEDKSPFHPHSQKVKGRAKGGLGAPEESGRPRSQVRAILPFRR